MNNSEYGVGIIGVGKYIPKKNITNADLQSWTGLTSDSIVEKTGIENRCIAEDSDTASGMSASAAIEAINNAGIKPEQIDLIIGCVVNGDYLFPALACKIQELIGAWNAGAFDLMANCTSFQIGISTAAEKMYFDSSIRYVLVVGTALQSRYINWKDPNTAIYFGDGSGAAVLGRVPKGYGVLATDIFSNGRVFDAVRLRGGGSSFTLNEKNINAGYQFFEVSGLEVWKQVVQNQPTVIRRVLKKIDKEVNDVDFFIFHQANLRLIEFLMKRMKHPMEKTITNVEKIGNTAEASIAIAMCEAVCNNLIKKDDLVVMSGVGAGFTFGATAIKWY